MTKKLKFRLFAFIVLSVVLFYSRQEAQGLILHPGGEPNLVEWTDRPDSSVIGCWGRVGSCVVISRNCVIATRHQGGKKGTPVQVGTMTYFISEIWDHNEADLRIAKLHGANFTNYARIYDGNNEMFKETVIAGYGVGRGRRLEYDGKVYGYQWRPIPGLLRRFGTNRIEAVNAKSNHKGLKSDIIIAFFDGPNSQRATKYECIPTGRDSGGGWFINDGGQWMLVGISRTVQGHSSGDGPVTRENNTREAWFQNPNRSRAIRGDYFDAIRLSSYIQWIKKTLPKPMAGDFNGDDVVDYADLSVLAQLWMSCNCEGPNPCMGADLDLDGDVDSKDMDEFIKKWQPTENARPQFQYSY